MTTHKSIISLLISVLAFGVVTTSTTLPTAADPAPLVAVQRISGASPVDAAIGVSRQTFPAGAAEVFIVGAGAEPDALSATSLSGGPLLLVPHTVVPEPVLDELGRLGVRKISILGGLDAVGAGVETQLSKAGYEVGRIAGADRRSTSSLVAQSSWRQGTPRVYLARDDVPADATAAGAISDGPVLLVSRTGVGAGDLRRSVDALDPAEVVALGGPSALPDQVVAAAAGGRPVRRLAGPDRYATNAAILQRTHAGGAQTVFVSAADSAIEGLLAATADVPVLSLPGCGVLPSSLVGELDRLNPQQVVVIGSAESVCPATLTAISQVVGGTVLDGPWLVEHEAFRTGGQRWTLPEVTWALERATPDVVVTVQVREISRSFTAWSDVSGLRFRQVGREADANIRLGFFDGADPWGRKFSPDILGWGSLGHDSSNHAYLSFNDAFMWTTAALTGSQQHLLSTLMHEIGHSLAVSHPCERNERGCESYRGGALPASYRRQVMWWQQIHALTELSSDDVDAIRSLYGQRPPDPTPTPTPTPPLSVSFSENPFTCDGGLRPFGTVAGAAAGERVSFQSPQLGTLTPGTASGSGEVPIRWQCDPSQASGRWTVTAKGESSGRTVTFTVTGRSAAPRPTPDPAPTPTPTPSRQVSIAKGAPYQASWCTHPSCARIQVNVSGYPANSTVSYGCYSTVDESGPFYTTTLRTDDAGNGSSATCVFGYPNRQVWVIADGTASGRLTWS